MDKRQGIKARAQAHREIQTHMEESVKNEAVQASLDDTHYINTNSEIFGEYEEKYTDTIQVNTYDGKARYNKGNRPKRKGSWLKKIMGTCLLSMAVIGLVGGVLYKERYGLSDEVMDINEYYSATDGTEQDKFIILNHEQLDYNYIVEGDMTYLPYRLVNNELNAKIHWDYNDELLLYSYPLETEIIDLNRELDEHEVQVAIKVADELYISMEYIEERTNLEWKLYEEPNRIVINNNYEEYNTVNVVKNTQIRYRGGVKSGILSEISKGQQLELLEAGEEWHKVTTEDGLVGYIPVSSSGEFDSKQRVKKIDDEIYTRNLVDYKICMGWHQTTNTASNQNLDVVVNGTKNTITTIAPTWFFIDDTLGNIKSLASKDYVVDAHERGIDVWATLNDFDAGIGTHIETYYALNSTSKRAWIIEQVMEEVLACGIDGINVDIELVSVDAGNHFIQFLRELSIECRINGIVLSVDNYPPVSYNAHYEWSEQADVVDYVIIMGYDEFYGGSKQAGPVSSITYTEDGITEMLKYVPAERLVNAIPFYSRLWEEVPKTDEEIAADAGSADEEYSTKVSSASYGMAGAKAKAAQAGAVTNWDYYTKHNYATWSEGSKTYKIWFEDEDAVREKLIVMDKYELAGVAAWKLGIEEMATWDLMLDYLEE